MHRVGLVPSVLIAVLLFRLIIVNSIISEWMTTKKLHYKKGCWCCCYIAMFVIMALWVGTLIVLSQEPRVSPSVQPQYVQCNSTVELLFDNMPWLDHITLAMTENCDAKLYQIQDQDCCTLPTLNTSYVSPTDKADFIYMLPGSVIHFNVDSNGDGQIWIFSDYNTLNEFTTDSSHFDCHNPPSGADCLLAEEHHGNYAYTITRPAYYFIRFSSENTAESVHWYFNRTIFDIKAITDKYPNSVTLTRAGNTISFPFPYKKSCILLNVPAEMCCSYGEMLPTNAARQEDYLIFPAIPLVVCVIILIVLMGVHIYCHYKFIHTAH